MGTPWQERMARWARKSSIGEYSYDKPKGRKDSVVTVNSSEFKRAPFLKLSPQSKELKMKVSL